MSFSGIALEINSQISTRVYYWTAAVTPLLRKKVYFGLLWVVTVSLDS